MDCPSCGISNPTGKKFCGDCGTSLLLSCAACGAEIPRARGSAATAVRRLPTCKRRPTRAHRRQADSPVEPRRKPSADR